MAQKVINATWTGGKGNWKAKVKHGEGKQGSVKVLGELVGTVTDFSGEQYDLFVILNA
jgi:hypothetical protein